MSNEIVTANATAKQSLPECVCTVDTSTREGAITVVNALSDAQSLADYVAEDMDAHFVITDVIMTEGERNRTGETCTNTYLILNTGEILMSQSDGIKRSIIQFLSVLGGNFGDGIEVSVTTKNLKNGNTMKSLHFYA